MAAFQSLTGDFFHKAEELRSDLMFDLNLDIDLSKVKDEMTNMYLARPLFCLAPR
jgi:hypothetical protein